MLSLYTGWLIGIPPSWIVIIWNILVGRIPKLIINQPPVSKTTQMMLGPRFSPSGKICHSVSDSLFASTLNIFHRLCGFKGIEHLQTSRYSTQHFSASYTSDRQPKVQAVYLAKLLCTSQTPTSQNAAWLDYVALSKNMEDSPKYGKFTVELMINITVAFLCFQLYHQKMVDRHPYFR